jgi:hypothetical protein
MLLGVWVLLVVISPSAAAAPLIAGFVDGFRNRFNWRVYADDAPENPQPKPGEFTYVYWQQAIGGEIPLYSIGLTDGDINNLGTLSGTGFIELTGVEPDVVGSGFWDWNGVTLTQGQRTASLYVTSPHAPGQIGALVYNCNPIVCDIGATATIGPVDPPPGPGDYNLNGSVGPEDYVAWKAAFGSADFAADGNQDGIVDAADYTIWRDHFGTGDGGAAALANSIPEPHAGGLLLVIFVACVTRIRKQREAASEGS